mgnify:CR=1 FL=1
MRLAFISTILGYPWGGADTLWTRAAEAAHERGDPLLLSVSTAVTRHQRIATLIKGGAAVVVRDPVAAPPSFGARVRRKLGLARSPIGGTYEPGPETRSASAVTVIENDCVAVAFDGSRAVTTTLCTPTSPGSRVPVMAPLPVLIDSEAGRPVAA